MKTHQRLSTKKGFTLMELMVAMAITTIIVTVLVSITSIALDTWNRSRAELRASRQGKTMVDTMARDFEALVTRKGNANEWLSAIVEPTLNDIGTGTFKSPNAAQLIFLTATTDRYNGQLTYTKDGPDYRKGDQKPGDISCVAYQLSYEDPIDENGEFRTFLFKRLLVNPAPDKEDPETYSDKNGGGDTFADLLGKENLANAFDKYKKFIVNPENFICENIYQFSATFHVQVAETGSGPNVATTYKDVPVTVGSGSSGQMTKDLRISGAGIIADVTGGATPEQLKAGRLTAVEISVSVLSDFGIDQIRSRKFSATAGKTVEEVKAEFLAKNSYQYSKLVQVPSM